MEIKYVNDLGVSPVEGNPLLVAANFPWKDYSVILDGGKGTAQADVYGVQAGYGSGRAVLYRGYHIKGVGATPLATLPEHWYRTGKLPLADGYREYFWLSALRTLYPKGVAPQALITIPDMAKNNLAWYIERGKLLSDLPEDRQWDAACLLVRDFPQRITHVFQSTSTPDEKFQWLVDGNKDLPHDPKDRMVFIRAFILKFCDVQAELWSRRISTGGLALDNYTRDCLPFDVTTMTVKRDFRNTHWTASKTLFWDEGFDTLQSLAYALVENFFPMGSNDYVAFCNSFYAQLRDWFDGAKLQASTKLLGLSQADLAHLNAEAPFELMFLQQELVSWLKWGTDAPAGEAWDFSDWSWANQGIVGNDFTAVLPALVSGADAPTAKSLKEAWDGVAPYLPADPQRVARCQALCSWTSELRGDPEVGQVTATIRSRNKAEDWPKLFQTDLANRLNKFSTTVGSVF